MFDSSEFSFTEGLNFLIGPNAAGKTSILEAISVAFTGRALTVDDPKTLVKSDKRGPAEIVLDFSHDSRIYRISRTLSKDRLLDAKIYCNQRLLEENWDKVTEFLMRLLGMSRNFFERVLYMSEGAVFRFASNPPKEGITQEIEEALGIDSMESLLDAVKSEENRYKPREKELRLRKKRLKRLLPKERREISILVRKIREKEKSIEQNRKLVDNLLSKIWNCQEEIRKTEKIISIVKDIMQRYAHFVDPRRFEEGFVEETQHALKRVRLKQEETLEKIDATNERKGMLEEQKRSLDEIFHLLKAVDEESELGRKVVRCPVCRKRFSVQEAATLLRKTERERAEADEELLEVTQDLEKNRGQLAKLGESIRDLEFRMMETKELFEELRIESTRKSVLSDLLFRKKAELEKLSSNREARKKELSELEMESHTLHREMERIEIITEFERVEDIDKLLLQNTKALMALNLLKKATQETVRIQREKKLDPVYEEIKNVWNELRKERQSSVRFDDKTIPVLYRGGAKFGFQQLSGGEKIALFTIVRTVLCRRFTRMGFMLLDEPLEHLDSGNRRLIVDFLVEAFEKGWVDQLLVTTFEESVVRKFSDHKQVSITTL